jgi:hypothetical protein
MTPAIPQTSNSLFFPKKSTDISVEEKDACLNMLKTIWSSAKCMHLMTLSQILHFKLDCDQLEFQATELKNKGFTAYMDLFLKPFQI